MSYDLFVYIDISGNLLGDFFVQVNFVIELFCLLSFCRVQLSISSFIIVSKLAGSIKLIIIVFFEKMFFLLYLIIETFIYLKDFEILPLLLVKVIFFQKDRCIVLFNRIFKLSCVIFFHSNVTTLTKILTYFLTTRRIFNHLEIIFH